MLEKIKVYNRNTSDEVNLETVRIGFGESLWLFVGADSSPTEQKLKLTKTDPLNKFKREIDGWWFSEKYVVAGVDTAVKCEYYNFIEKEYVVGDPRGRSQMFIDLNYSEVLYNNGGAIPKYLNRWQIKEPSFNLNAGQYSLGDLDTLEAQIHLKREQWKEMLQKNENPKYIAFQKFVIDLGLDIKHNEDYEFTYKSLGEDMYIELLNIIGE